MASISSRGRRMTEGHTFPQYIFEDLERRSDAWDPSTNPDGYIGMCTAENKLMWDMLGPRLLEARLDLPAAALGYDDMAGNIEFRSELSAFLGRAFLGREFDPANLMVLSGAGTVLETLFYAIADRGDSILLPTPAYPGFWVDLEGRDELEIVPVHTSPESGFALTTDLLDQAYSTATTPVRALLFTSPNNPVGTVYSRTEVATIVDWCRSREIHAVFDEVYALSVFGEEQFESVARDHELGDDIHIVWAFSKDFAMSGLRSGVLITENEAVCEAVGAQAYWGSTPGDTQHVLRTIIADSTWTDRYIGAMQTRLGESYRIVAEELAEVGIPTFPSSAGFFLIADMRGFLSEPTWDAEEELWRSMLEDAKVNVTPGATCHNPEPGYMRVCFAAVSPPAVRVGVQRIGRLLAAD